jgi:hypothetical protein
MSVTRLVGFAGSTVALNCDTPRLQRIVDFLFQFIPPAGDLAPRATYSLTETTDGELKVVRGKESIYEGDNDGALAEHLLGDVCHELIVDSKGGMMYHSAGLAWKGRGILIPGGIGAGKSTLTTWLVSRGFDYLTDELVYFQESSDMMNAFSRPLHLKNPSRAVLGSLVDYPNLSEGVIDGSYSDMVVPTLFNPDNSFVMPPLKMILFPRFSKEEEFELTLLSKAQAGLHLMQCLVNARNLPDLGFSEAVRIAKIAPAYRLVYSRFDQLEGKIEAILKNIAIE